MFVLFDESGVCYFNEAHVIVLGIDPGLAHSGWGVIRAAKGEFEPVAYGHISTSPRDPISIRLDKIYTEVSEVVRRYQPQTAAVEGIFFGVNAKSAFSIGEARAAAILAVARQGIGLQEYSPAQIKQTVVGNGRAEKAQVAYMVKMRLVLDHTPTPDHCSDALAIAITHATLAGF